MTISRYSDRLRSLPRKLRPTSPVRSLARRQRRPSRAAEPIRWLPVLGSASASFKIVFATQEQRSGSQTSYHEDFRVVTFLKFAG
jgi:hypothetical protein